MSYNHYNLSGGEKHSFPNPLRLTSLVHEKSRVHRKKVKMFVVGNINYIYILNIKNKEVIRNEKH